MFKQYLLKKKSLFTYFCTMRSFFVEPKTKTQNCFGIIIMRKFFDRSESVSWFVIMVKQFSINQKKRKSQNKLFDSL